MVIVGYTIKLLASSIENILHKIGSINFIIYVEEDIYYLLEVIGCFIFCPSFYLACL